MNRRAYRWAWIATCLAVMDLAAQDTVTWNSEANAVNLTSAGAPMDAGFRFEVGVFSGSFVPTLANRADWASHWAGHQRSAYDPTTKRFSGSFVVTENPSPFSAGKNAYVWGFRGDALSGEWILFRAPTWTWPDSDLIGLVPPSFHEWFCTAATPVVGEIHAGGSPFLMKSAAITNAAPPTTTYAQWQVQYLTGEPLDGPGQDPDRDGVPNLLEFIFGTPPKTAGAPVATPVALVGGHLRITVPRRVDRPAVLTVEVSGDLTNWFSGPSRTQVLIDGIEAIVVEDLTLLDSAHPRRFIRVRAGLP